MLSTNGLVIVCAGKDTLKASTYDIQLLQLYISVGKGMSLNKLYIPAKTKGDILGISDIGITEGDMNFCVKSILHEFRKGEFKAIFADFERKDQVVLSLLSQLDEMTYKQNIEFYVPICNEKAVKYANFVTHSALSGGSLEEYILELNEKYNDRIAVSIRPICTDFILPSQNSEGTPISQQEKQHRMKKYNAGAYFSRELCAKYFTYMDENEQGHFVLFDDLDTISDKIRRLNNLPVKKIFALYPDIEKLLTN